MNEHKAKTKFIIVLMMSLIMTFFFNLSHAASLDQVGITWGQKTVQKAVTDNQTVVQNNSLLGFFAKYTALNQNWRSKIEYSQVSSSESEGNYKITNASTEYALWQHYIVDLNFSKQLDIAPYFGAGWSFEDKTSKMSFANTTSDESNNTASNSFLLSVGLDISYKFLYFSIEGRSKFKNEYQKQTPEYSYVWGLGFNLSI